MGFICFEGGSDADIKRFTNAIPDLIEEQAGHSYGLSILYNPTQPQIEAIQSLLSSGEHDSIRVIGPKRYVHIALAQALSNLEPEYRPMPSAITFYDNKLQVEWLFRSGDHLLTLQLFIFDNRDVLAFMTDASVWRLVQYERGKEEYGGDIDAKPIFECIDGILSEGTRQQPVILTSSQERDLYRTTVDHLGSKTKYALHVWMLRGSRKILTVNNGEGKITLSGIRDSDFLVCASPDTEDENSEYAPCEYLVFDKDCSLKGMVAYSGGREPDIEQINDEWTLIENPDE